MEMTENPNVENAVNPISETARIDSIDVLRGVAVLGILALNIQAFAMPGTAYQNPTSYGNLEGINYWLWYFVHLFGDMKFWSIFSMLFGAGIVILTERCDATGRSAAGIHYRRMLWLILFGLLHAHLIWYGDILYTYGMCGLVLYFFRRLHPAVLIGLAVIPLMVAFGISLAFGWVLASNVAPEMNQELAADWFPGSERQLHELETYRSSWLTQTLEHRSLAALMFETFLFAIAFGWRSSGMILIGMGLYKLGVFSAARSNVFYWSCIAVAAFIGLPLIAYGVYQNEKHGWALEYAFFYGSQYNYWGSILVAIGWVGVTMLVCKSSQFPWITSPLGAVGRMALSCYLAQSVLATTIFYGHGFGQFGYFERWQQYLTVVGIWVFCLFFASLWLRFFQFGPMEWLWRSLTYMRLQPMLRKGAA
jgi:uncharacterized protein